MLKFLKYHILSSSEKEKKKENTITIRKHGGENIGSLEVKRIYRNSNKRNYRINNI